MPKYGHLKYTKDCYYMVILHIISMKLNVDMSIYNSTLFAVAKLENMIHADRKLSMSIYLIFMKAIEEIPRIVVFLWKIVSEEHQKNR